MNAAMVGAPALALLVLVSGFAAGQTTLGDLVDDQIDRMERRAELEQELDDVQEDCRDEIREIRRGDASDRNERARDARDRCEDRIDDIRDELRDTSRRLSVRDPIARQILEGARERLQLEDRLEDVRERCDDRIDDLRERTSDARSARARDRAEERIDQFERDCERQEERIELQIEIIQDRREALEQGGLAARALLDTIERIGRERLRASDQLHDIEEDIDDLEERCDDARSVNAARRCLVQVARLEAERTALERRVDRFGDLSGVIQLGRTL